MLQALASEDAPKEGLRNESSYDGRFVQDRVLEVEDLMNECLKIARKSLLSLHAIHLHNLFVGSTSSCGETDSEI